MLSRILVGVDDSEYGEKAFDFAVLIAKRFESRLLIAHIIEGSRSSMNWNRIANEFSSNINPRRTISDCHPLR